MCKGFLMARFRFSFWLDADKDDDLLLMEEIDLLKKKRKFSRYVRDGIRLMIDLHAGNLDVLFELFPHLKTKFTSDDSGSGTGGLKAIHDKLERLEQISLQNTAPTGYLMAAKESVIGGPKPLTGGLKKITAPTVDDDDEDLLLIKKDTSTDAGMNFLKSAWALQGN